MWSAATTISSLWPEAFSCQIQGASTRLPQGHLFTPGRRDADKAVPLVRNARLSGNEPLVFQDAQHAVAHAARSCPALPGWGHSEKASTYAGCLPPNLAACLIDNPSKKQLSPSGQLHRMCPPRISLRDSLTTQPVKATETFPPRTGEFLTGLSDAERRELSTLQSRNRYGHF